MKKYLFTIIVMIMVLLFPTVVNAQEEESWISREKDVIKNYISSIRSDERVEEMKEVISNASERVRNYIDEFRNNDDGEEQDNQELESNENGENNIISVVSDNNNLEASASVEYDKETDHVGIHSLADVAASITNIDKPLKSSEGNISTNIMNNITLHNEKLLKNYSLSLDNAKSNGLGYSLNKDAFNFNTYSSNLLSSEYNYQRKNLLGKVRKEVEKATSLGSDSSFEIDVEKTKSDNKNIYDILLNKTASAFLDSSSKKTRHGLLFDYTIEKNLSISAAISFTRNITIETPSKEESLPVDPDDDEVVSGVVSANPLTMDTIKKDMILLLVSIVSLLGIIYVGKKELRLE